SRAAAAVVLGPRPVAILMGRRGWSQAQLAAPTPRSLSPGEWLKLVAPGCGAPETRRKMGSGGVRRTPNMECGGHTRFGSFSSGIGRPGHSPPETKKERHALSPEPLDRRLRRGTIAGRALTVAKSQDPHGRGVAMKGASAVVAVSAVLLLVAAF